LWLIGGWSTRPNALRISRRLEAMILIDREILLAASGC
jgi:hypothetical protein